MGKIVITEFISLEGVVQAPGGHESYKHAGWTNGITSGDEGTKFKYDELMEAEVQLLGRVTYEGFAAAWPGMIEATGDFGQKMTDMPNTSSRQPSTPPSGTTRPCSRAMWSTRCAGSRSRSTV